MSLKKTYNFLNYLLITIYLLLILCKITNKTIHKQVTNVTKRKN
jgi:hypothetical protein